MQNAWGEAVLPDFTSWLMSIIRWLWLNAFVTKFIHAREDGLSVLTRFSALEQTDQSHEHRFGNCAAVVRLFTCSLMEKTRIFRRNA